MNHFLKSWCRLILVMSFSFSISVGMYAQISTQVGIGALYINGDVDPVIDPLNSFHLGVCKTFRNYFNAELKLGFSKTVGLSGIYMESAQNGGGLVENIYSDVGNDVWYPNYLSTYAYADLGVNYILNTGIERLRLIGGAGIGISISNTSVNLLQGDTVNYMVKLPVTNDLNVSKDLINRLYDTTYETKFDGGGTTPHLSLQFGVQFRITRGIFFSADVRYHLTASDYLDPIQNITADQMSGNYDSVSIFTIGFVGYLLSDNSDDRSPLNKMSDL